MKRRKLKMLLSHKKMKTNKPKKVQSKEKCFFDYMKKLYPLNGVIGTRGIWNTDLKPEKFIKGTEKFLIFDENFKVIFENEPFNKSGNYHPNVVKKLKEFDLRDDDSDDDDDSDIAWEKTTRTDDSVEDLISSINTSASLRWYCNFHSNDVDENFFPKRLPEKSLDVEKSSKEFEEFDKVCDFMNDAVKNNSKSKLDLRAIEYELYTEKGKQNIKNCIKWFENNKSKTPIQDAWFKVLEKNGVKVNWKPFDSWCEVPIMKNIDYSSKQELEERHKKEREEFKKSITPETRAELKKIAERLRK